MSKEYEEAKQRTKNLVKSLYERQMTELEDIVAVGVISPQFFCESIKEGNKIRLDKEINRMEERNYQQLVSNDNSPRKLICWPRRSGKSTYIVQSAIEDITLGRKVIIIGFNKFDCQSIQSDIISEFESNGQLKKYLPFITNSISSPFIRFKLESPFGQLEVFSGGDRGVCMCGHDADKIYVNEGTSVNRSIYIQCILPLLQSTPDTSIEILFTPTVLSKSNGNDSGAAFIKALWDEDPQWEHFHIDYKWLPRANQIREDKPNFKWETWRTEMLAEWVEADETKE